MSAEWGLGGGWVGVGEGRPGESDLLQTQKSYRDANKRERGGGKKSNFISHQISAAANATFLLLRVTDQILLRETLFLGWKCLIGI